MANSWNGPQLGRPIRTDVPELQKKLIALLKQDPTSVADIPSGAKRLVNLGSAKWQVHTYNGTSWSAIGKLMHDVDKLDGYHAAITPSANTVAVRNADKKLEGDITGNAATASSATTLSQTLPVNKGGTGATTSAQARTNLGVPPTSHASSSTTYGLATDNNYGHVRSDRTTTNIVAGEVLVKNVAIGADTSDLARDRGQIGNCPYINTKSINIDELFKSGFYRIFRRGDSVGTFPNQSGGSGYLMVFSPTSSEKIYHQILTLQDYKSIYIRFYNNSASAWDSWVKVIGETDLATSSTPGLVTIDKTNGTTDVRNRGEFYVVSSPKQLSYNVVGASGQYQDVCTAYRLENGSSGNSRVLTLRAEAGVSYNGVAIFSTNQDTNDFGAWFRVYDYKSGTKLCFTNCDLQVNNGNGVVVAANVLQTGDLVASMGASHRGCLLCNGSAVSRTTYANLFALLGTTFGEGDGSTTFNLPDFRNRTFWGADGNLKTLIAAGLPNITAYRDFRHNVINAGAKDGAFRNEGITNSQQYMQTNAYANLDRLHFNASWSNSIYGNSTTVQPPAIAVNIFIKY